jgi:hypothetical protein
VNDDANELKLIGTSSPFKNEVEGEVDGSKLTRFICNFEKKKRRDR